MFPNFRYSDVFGYGDFEYEIFSKYEDTFTKLPSVNFTKIENMKIYWRIRHVINEFNW